MNNNLLTANGKIHCKRCMAQSKRTGVQCGRPASKGSKTQKCHMHGGRGNSAPKTVEGRQRVAAAHTKSGQYSNMARLEQSKGSARLARLEDAMHVLGMSTGPRTRGRKSNHYVPITSVEDVRRMMVDEILHRDRGSNDP